MNINRRRFTVLGAVVFLIGGVRARAGQPEAISDLFATTGSGSGSIALNWSAPSDGGNAAEQYLIRYRVDGVPITEANFTASNPIEGPPLLQRPIAPGAPSNPEIQTITGLTPGVTYYFAIKSLGNGAQPNLSTLSNVVFAPAGQTCGPSPADGSGNASLVLGSNFSIGSNSGVKVQFQPSSSFPLGIGGSIQFQIPDGWIAPQTADSTAPGYVNINPLSQIGMALSSPTVSGRFITTSVVSGSWTQGIGPVIMTYHGGTCQISNTNNFRVFIQAGPCGQMKEISDSVNGTLNVTTQPGLPSFINFDNYNIAVRVGDRIPITFTARDLCGNLSPVPNTFNVQVSALVLANGVLAPDDQAAVSPTPSPWAPFSGGTGTVGITGGQATGAVYYSLVSAANNPNDQLSLTYNALPGNVNGGQTVTTILPVSAGVTGLSVDTGALTPNQNTVTFSPDNDGTADTAFINFTFPVNVNWKVMLSKDNFSTITRTLFGYGINGRVGWDGFTDGLPGVGGAIAAPGTYAVKIQDQGTGTLEDHTTLSITLAAGGVSGHVLSSVQSLSALTDVEVDASGPAFRSGRTDGSGNFTLYGLKAGAYNLHFSKSGYTAQDVAATVSATAVTALSQPVDLSPAAVLRISVRRPSDGGLPEVWGQVQANTPDWSKQASGTIHFQAGAITSDAGDLWQPTPTPYTDLNLVPDTSFKISFNIPGTQPDTAVSPVTISLAASPLLLSVNLVRQPNLGGLVQIPTGTGSANGTSVSVEVCPDANSDQICDDQNAPDPSKHFYGGAWIPAGQTSIAYQINGVTKNQTYLVIARADGFIPQKINAAVAVADNLNANVPILSQGGTLTGTVTILGDTTPLDTANNGFFDIDINAFSPATYGGSSRHISNVTASPTSTSFTYSISGLVDGAYNLYLNLPGFEPNPSGPLTATVASATGTKDITFRGFSGTLQVQVTAPAGITTYSSDITVDIQSLSSQNNGQKIPAGTWAANNGNTYTLSNLGTDIYTVRVQRQSNHFISERSVHVANGTTTSVVMDVTGTTYKITGTVVTNAASPYNTLSQLATGTTPQIYLNLSTLQNVPLPGNRIIARRFNEFTYYAPVGGVTASYDPRSEYYGVYGADGTYEIDGISPGVYVVFNNDELDGNSADGAEIAKTQNTIYVSQDTVQNFTLTSGVNISGTIRVSAADTTGRPLQIYLQDNSNNQLNRTTVSLNGTQVSFTLANVPAGDYLLVVQDGQSPVKYVAKPLSVKAQTQDITGLDIPLLSASHIQGQLRVATSGELIGANNYQSLLSDSFQIQAQANPWIAGGSFPSDSPIINANGMFTIAVNPGTYDLYFQNNDSFNPAAELAQGKKVFVPIVLAGIQISEGQTRDLGVIDMREGTPVSGRVVDRNGNGIPNISVEALPSGSNQNNNNNAIRANTDSLGSYVLYGIDRDKTRYYDIIAAPRQDRNDPRYAQDIGGTLYGEVRKKLIDTQTVTTVPTITLVPAPGSLIGQVLPATGQTLITPFGDSPQPGAEVIANRQGSVPNDNPLGDDEITSAPDGHFNLTGLVPGTYDVWFLSEGHANGFLTGVVAGATPKDVGTIQLKTGNKLSGSLSKSDGTPINQSDVDGLVAVNGGFQTILIAKTNIDPSGSITSYSLTGFEKDKTYDILVFNNNQMSRLATGVVVNDPEQTMDLVIRPQAPLVLSQAAKKANGDMVVKFALTAPARNSAIDLDNNGIADDNDLAKIITKISGAGTLTIPADAISSDRTLIQATYTPDAADATFSLHFRLAFNVTDDGGAYYVDDETFTYHLGIGDSVTGVVTSAGGGTVQLTQNTAAFSAPSGMLNVESAAITMRAADTATDLSAATSATAASLHGHGAGAMAVAAKRGPAAYPTEMAAAINNAKINSITPFSSFYDLFLPAGVSHFFPLGKEAQLCLAYDDGVSDPYSLNVYYYNTQSNEYLLENKNKLVDTDNQRLCVNVSHASVFTVLDSSASVLSGAGYTGALALMNFPNPFNLKQKTVTLQDPGNLNASQTITGTMIKMSVPVSMSGEAQIEIYDVSGEKIRTLSTQIANGGAHYYIEWDGKNDHGKPVASGTYIARFTIGGGNERFFKMAVLK